MKNADNTIQLLSDLLKINRERVERCKKASYDVHDSELKSVFGAIADESRSNITEISTVLLKNFDITERDNPPKPGKILRSWVNVKSKFNGTLRNKLLNSCEFEEGATIAAYTMAKLISNNSVYLSELIDRQLELLRASLAVVKSYRQAFDKLEKMSI